MMTGKKKGFRREPTLYKLHFADEEFNGLEVTAKSLPLREFFELQKLQSAAQEDAGASEKIIRKLGDVLVEWNLEDEEGNPVTADYDGLGAQELSFVFTVFRAWMEAVASVPNHLRPGSNGSGTSVELSLPMEAS